MLFNIPIFYLLTACIEICIVLLLLVLFVRTGKAKNTSVQKDARQITNLEGAFKKVMSDSEAASHDLLSRVDNKIQSLKEVLLQAEDKEKSLKQYMLGIDKLLQSIDKKKQENTSGISDPYQQAADLLSKGYSPQDIQRDCGLGLNEIELIKQLVRLKSA